MKKTFKRIMSAILSVALISSTISVSAFNADPDDNKILYISQASELKELSNSVNSGNNYLGYTLKLKGDINLNNVSFTPIGTEQHPFAGVFHGDGYTIKNLKIQGDSGVALFGYNIGTIMDIKVEGNVTGTTNVAIVAGVNAGNMLNCRSFGYVTANNNNSSNIGGIVGNMCGGLITICDNMANITTNGRYCGGIAGYASSGKIFYSGNHGGVTAEGTDGGGIVGYFKGGIISRCYNSCQIESSGTCGGIVGYANGGNVDNSLNIGTIIGSNANSGGIIGGIDGSEITNCFSKSEVNSTQHHGGAVGWNRSGSVKNCYSNSGTLPVVGQTDVTGTTDDCNALDENNIKDKTFFVGFDFDLLWEMDENYPVLSEIMPDSTLVYNDFEWLQFDIFKGENTSADNITKNLSLPLSGKLGSDITWTSSDPTIMLDSGIPLKSGNVTMTANVSLGLDNSQKQFDLKVTADNSIEPMHILQIGDSNTQFARITQSMNKLLKGKYGNYGDGFITLCKDYVSIESKNMPENLDIAYVGDWKQYDLVDGPTAELKQAQDSPFGLYLRNQNAGDWMTVTFESSAIDLYYYSWVSAGTFSVTIDGVNKGEVDQKSSSVNENTTKKASYDNLGFGLHTMVIKNVSGDINFYGADYRISGAENRANISTWGKAGIQAMQYANVLNPSIFDSALKLLNPDKVVLLIGTNDNGLSRCSAANLEIYLNTILTRIKKALPNAEILLVSTFETNNDKSILHSYWDTSFPNAAKNNNVHYWSMGEWYGDFSSILMIDGWHSNNAGSKLIAEKMYDVIESGKDLIGRDIEEVNPLETIKVKTGTSVDKLILPEKVLVKLDDVQNTSKYVYVDWNKDGYNPVVGNYTLHGSFNTSKEKRINNPDNLSVSVNVSVEDNYNPPSDLITSYNFTDIKDNTVNDLQKNNNATLVNAQVTNDGYIGSGIKLSGNSSSYLNLPSKIFNQSDNVTISTWVKLNSISNWTTLMSIGSNQNNYAVLAAKGNPNNQNCGITLAIKANGGNEYRIKADVTNVVPTNQWVQIVYTQEYGMARLYLNGKKVAENSEMRAIIRDVVKVSSSVSTRLGSANVWGDPAINGSIDEFKTYTRSLTESEILYSYNYDVNLHNNPPPKHPENGVWIEGNKTVLYKNNIKVTGTKTETIGSVTYAVKDGFVLTGKIQLFSISNMSYVVDKNGVVQKSSTTFKIINIGTKSYIIDKNGLIQKSSKGYKLILKSYIVNTKGEAQKSSKGYKLISISKTSFIVNSKGVVQKSKSGNKFISISKTSYIVNSKGEVQKSSKGYKLVKVGSKKYIVNKSGLVQKNKKVKVGKIQYKTDKKGIANKIKK